MDNLDFRLLCSEILNSFSFIDKFGGVYLRHFTILNYADFDFQKQKFLNYAKEQNLPTPEEKEKLLIEHDQWSEQKNKDIITQENFLKTLRATKEKKILQKDIDIYNDTISKEEEKLNKLRIEKFQLLGLTTESYANSELNEYQVRRAFYKDKELTNSAYSNFDDLDQSTIDNITAEFYNQIDRFSEYNLRRVAYLPFFYNSFSICNNDSYRFYGRAVIDLTYYQVEIFKWATSYKNILSNCDVSPPEDTLTDPDKLIDWFNCVGNARKLMDGKTGNVSIVGATSKDYQRLGIK